MLIMRRALRRGYAAIARKYSAEGKTILITGANSGIGLAAATEFARKGGRVILACRDREKAQNTVYTIRNKTSKGTLVVKHLNLEYQSSVKALADDLCQSEEKLDVLVNNAGVMGLPFALTEDGIERTFATNHLGHFILTNMLLDLLKKSQEARIIMVSSLLYKKGRINLAEMNTEPGYTPKDAYSSSKLANIMFANVLSKKLKGSSVTINSLSPGMVRTGLARNGVFNSWFKSLLFHTVGHILLRTPEHGAETIIYCALDPGLKGVSGKFFRDCEEKELLPLALDRSASMKLWDACVDFTHTE